MLANVFQNIESDRLGQTTTFTNHDSVSRTDSESRRAMDGDVLVTLLVTTVLGDEMEVITTDNNGALHLSLCDDTAEDTTTDRDVGSERAFLVNVSAFDSLTWSLESETNVLVVTVTLLQLLSDSQRLPLGVLEDSRLFLVRALSLIGHDCREPTDTTTY